jgi:translation elongation factor EF-G
MVSSALNISFLTGEPKLYEPVLKVNIKTPLGTEGEIIKVINRHRGQVSNMETEEDTTVITALIPTAETLGIADEFRSATSGKAFFGYEFVGFQTLPENLQLSKILEIRKRKGLSEEMPTVKSWERFIYKM